MAAELSLRESCTNLVQDISHLPVLEFALAQQVGRLAKKLSAVDVDGQESIELLSMLRDACRDNGPKAVILNNLACAQRRSGELDAAVASLEAAVKMEGGMARALPTTLVNLSAALCARGLFKEAAAVANRAVAHGVGHRPSSPSATAKGTTSAKALAAAYFNLAVALHGDGQLQFAESAYRSVSHYVEETDPFNKAAVSALNALLVDNHDRAAQQWATVVAPTINLVAQRKKGNTVLPPLLPARNRSADMQTSDALVALPDRASSALGHHQPRLRRSDNHTNRRPNRHSIRSDIAQVYAADMRKFQCLPLLMSPVPYEDRVPQHDGLSPVRCKPSMASIIPFNSSHGVAGSACGGPALVDAPDWNADPVLAAHDLSYRVVHPSDKQNWALIHEIEARFIPRALVPLVEDIRYKEATRRTMIAKEWKRRFGVIRRARDLASITGEEDTARLDVEIEEARVRRVVKQWIAGKLLFAEAMIRLDREESSARDAISKEMVRMTYALQYAANRLHPQGLEETLRGRIVAEEREALSHLLISNEANLALLQSRASVKNNVKGIAYALALWCLEGVIPESDIGRIEITSRKQSIAVLERFVLFGKQVRPSSHSAVPE